jgi:hypothetical protein
VLTVAELADPTEYYWAVLKAVRSVVWSAASTVETMDYTTAVHLVVTTVEPTVALMASMKAASWVDRMAALKACSMAEY